MDIRITQELAHYGEMIDRILAIKIVDRKELARIVGTTAQQITAIRQQESIPEGSIKKKLHAFYERLCLYLLELSFQEHGHAEEITASYCNSLSSDEDE